MSDDESLIVRLLREIQRELADMRDDRTVMMAILNRLDATVSSHTVSLASLSSEMRAMRSQFDRLRNDVRGDVITRLEALEATKPRT